jgi:hypothetical protein
MRYFCKSYFQHTGIQTHAHEYENKRKQTKLLSINNAHNFPEDIKTMKLCIKVFQFVFFSGSWDLGSYQNAVEDFFLLSSYIEEY